VVVPSGKQTHNAGGGGKKLPRARSASPFARVPSSSSSSSNKASTQNNAFTLRNLSAESNDPVLTNGIAMAAAKRAKTQQQQLKHQETTTQQAKKKTKAAALGTTSGANKSVRKR